MKRTLDFTEGSEELPPAKVPCQRDLYCDSMAASSSSFPSSFSISSACQWKYDVFLSFRGEDTRNTLVDFLNYALQRRGIYIFKDDEKLEGGKTIKSELLKAIEESRFAVVILSEYYASSTWCLDELVKIVDCRKEKRMTVLPIFYNVDPSDVRKQTGTFAKAFDEHEKKLKEKVGTYRDALKHVADIAGHHQDKNRPLSEAVKWIVGQLSHIWSFEFSRITEGLVGIDSRLVELESCLALKDDVRFIGIWAMGGMGKTTLASAVYMMVSKEFEASCFIDRVREKDELLLQKELISQILIEPILIKNKYDGAVMIKKNLWNKKVLLVLDDVDDSKKLKMLVRKSDRFGSGSRIIITTRDKHLLREFPVDETFEVKALNYKDAHCLFCSKAFKKEQCPDEYLELSKSFLKYANGLPLALEVLGSFLFEKSTAEWKSELDMLKEGPDPEINDVLKISFKGLHYSVQDIFLDIACFFNHEEKDHVQGMLASIGRPSVIGLCILIDKSLLKIFKNNELWMHDLLRDMGRDIVRQESRDEPGKRSRLWFFEDIDHVLESNEGTDKVQAMDIREAKDAGISHEENEECWLGFRPSKKPTFWNPNAFVKMPNLKFLRVHNICPQFVPAYLPNKLAYLDWSNYPSKSLVCPNELVHLRLQCSKIELLWGGAKIFENLKSINMAGSSDLIISPNFNGVQNLEELVLGSCSNLRQVHPSIGKLKKLRLLDLNGCQELTSLPDKFEMESLVTLNLTDCLKVKEIPEFGGNMKLLQELLLEATAIIELPSSVECLTGLNALVLYGCQNLVRLPDTICSLTLLNYLDLVGCLKFDKLPKDLGNMTSLKGFTLSGTAIKELPSSVEFLIGLTLLDLSDCKKFDKLPKDFGNISSLKRLDLSGTAITELPLSGEFLIGLEELLLEDCKKFVLLPSTVCSMKSLETMSLSRCPKFVNLPENLENFKHLNLLSLDGTAIAVLPSSVGCLAALERLNLGHCKNLVCLPSTISNLKRVVYLDLTGCSKIANLPENLGNMESLRNLLLAGTAIEDLPSSAINLKQQSKLSFKGCQKLSSSSLTSVPLSDEIDLSDCNLSAIPSGIDRIPMTDYFVLFLSGNNFVSLPESISQFSGLYRLYLDGCKSLRSLSNIQFPSTVKFICVDNCTSLERLTEGFFPFFVGDCWQAPFTFQCFNCFKLAENFQNFSNMFQGQSSKQFEICCIIPGREIPKWFEEVNIYTSVTTSIYTNRTRKIRKVKIQLPGSGCDEWRGFVLCVVFLPIELHRRYQPDLYGFQKDHEIRVEYTIGVGEYYWCHTSPDFTSEYGEVESHHLWLQSVSKNAFCLPKTPGRSIDKKGFHEVELEIRTERLVEVEKIGFRVV